MFWLPLVLALTTTGPDAQVKRITELWTYEMLFKQSDLIVVAKFAMSGDAGKQVSERPPDKYLIGLLTTFDVVHVVKGEHKDKRLVLLHYRMKEGTRIGNGPRLVSFSSNRLRIEYKDSVALLDPPEYLMFLKKRQDSRYECVSGQIDPDMSVKQLITPLENRP